METIDKIKEIIDRDRHTYSILDRCCIYSIAECIDNQDLSLDEYIDELYISHYYEAIKFLAENDDSLRESLKLASDLGYSLDELSSEILASLLLQDIIRDVVYNKLIPAISDLDLEGE